MSYEDMSGWAMGSGSMGILFWIVLVLAVAALAKYLLGGRGDR